MDELLERTIRDSYVEDAASYDPSDAVLRLRNHRYPVRTSRPRRLWTAIGASSTALAGAVLAVILLLSSGAPEAYAGWNSVPSPASPAVIAATSSTCANAFTGTGAAANKLAFTGQQPVLNEVRGIYIALVAVSDGDLYACETHGDAADPNARFSLTAMSYGAVQKAPGADQISAPYRLTAGFGEGHGYAALAPQMRSDTPAERLELRRHISTGGYGPNVLGQTGSDVAAVTINLANGDTVNATVENGWYFGWWPWTTSPTSVTVTSGSGNTETSPMTSSGSLVMTVAPACQAGSTGCVFPSEQSTDGAGA